MSEFVRKTLTGYRAVDGGYSDQECTHVIMTKKEYGKLLDDKETAEVGRDNALRHVERQLREADNAARAREHQIIKDAGQQISMAKEELAEAQKKCEYYQGLNETLLRMNSERANTDRKLKPKKLHTGYVVFSSAEKEYRYKRTRRGDQERVILWETVMQSPYSVDFSGEQAIHQIFDDIDRNTEDETSPSLLKKIGISWFYGSRYEKLIGEPNFNEKWLEDYNIMLNWTIKANFRTGYWEISIMHTKAIGCVPPDMRARQANDE